MGYSGYEQNICHKGHFFETGVFAEDRITCPYCKSERAWVNRVDTTNGDEHGVIFIEELEQLTKEKREVCNLGHTHVVERATYRVPSEEETRLLRRV